MRPWSGTGNHERAGLTLDEAELRARFEQRLEGVSLFSVAPALVQSLARRGTRQLVLSNAEQGSLLRQIERWGLGALFEGVQGRSDTFASGKVEAGRALRSALGEARPQRADR